MMKYLRFAAISLLFATLSSCGPTKVEPKTFSIVWTNYDNSILLVSDVKEGETPTYNGSTPERAKEGFVSYSFSGWTPTVVPATMDATYKATFDEVVDTFTITWVNYDNSVLMTDNNVVANTMPEYKGTTPTKPDDSDGSYIFTGWTPTIVPATSNATYKAVFALTKNIPGEKPSLSADGKTLTYGLYPQSYVKDESLIEELEKLEPTEENGWYFLEDTYYVKETSDVYNNETYKFNDGLTIINETSYWFKCEPITWNILSKNENEYFLLSSTLLDSYPVVFDQEECVDTPNNYKDSDLRSWLNGNFLSTAFVLNNASIKTVEVDNSASTTSDNANPYVCENTFDKIYLPSYVDYLNSNYGFATNAGISTTRECKTSEYARATGAWCSKVKAQVNNGAYWTRSPSSEFSYAMSTINSSGYVSNYPVDTESQCIRPCITIRL